MKILVVGNGGREHAIAWKLANEKNVDKVYVAPGNGGTFLDNRLENINITDLNELASFVIDNNVNFTVVGPEVPLSQGIVDIFRAKNLLIFGPTQKAAQLESSKAFAKDFMVKHNIPTAYYKTFNDNTKAKDYIYEKGVPIVIKDDGLAAGKGVVVAMDLVDALNAVDLMLDGSPNKKIVIEEFLEGEEASFIVMCDGKNILPLATSQDHKRLLDKDLGPNTGGMGAYSPAPVITSDIHKKIMESIIIPSVNGMHKDGITFTGFLYAGVMIDDKGNPKTLEFNCRMGDPETQPIMARLKTNLAEVFQASFEQKLDTIDLDWDSRFALGVVLAAHNYPNTPKTGDVIHGIDTIVEDFDIETNTIIFHAGTINKEQKTITNGGRVLCVVGLGSNVIQAQNNAYAKIQNIAFDGMQYRKDIGNKAIQNQ